MRENSSYNISCDYADRVGSSFCSNKVRESSRRSRLCWIVFFALLWSMGIVYRLASLQLFGSDFWRSRGQRQHFSEVKIAAERGPIYDRNGQLMAVSVPASSIYVRPREINKKKRKKAIQIISTLLELEPERVEKAFDSQQPFVWLKRQVPRVYAEQLDNYKIAGVGHLLEARRFYPYKQAGSALIGRVGIDGNGLSGLEARYEKLLSRDIIKSKVIRDAKGNIITGNDDSLDHFEIPKGQDLHLTLDASIQYILDEELEKGRNEFSARAALGAIVDTKTGDILALGQAPTFNFNEDKIAGREALLNRAIETVFEPGSIMKPIVTAAALQGGVVHPTDIIDCGSGVYRYGGHNIKDTHRVGAVSVKDVVVHSSNIGMTKIGIKMGRDLLYDSLDRFGFGHPIGLNLPGETRGILRKKKDWSMVDIATHSFGQGVAVTPLQMLRALSSIVNGGILPNLRVIDDGNFEPGERILSEKTANDVREMMFAVVEDPHGTGKRAAIKGVRIGGKTGTAQKAREGGRGYAAGKYMASFMGFADAEAINIDDKLALIVVVDEPHKGSIYGGTVAAPIFKKVMTRVLYLLATRQRVKRKTDIYRNLDQDVSGLVRAKYAY